MTAHTAHPQRQNWLHRVVQHLQQRAGATPAALEATPFADRAYLVVSGAYLLLVTVGISLLFFSLLLHLFEVAHSPWQEACTGVVTALVLAGIHYLFMGSFYKILMAGELNGMGPRRQRTLISTSMLAKLVVAMLFGFIAALSLTVNLQTLSALPVTQETTLSAQNRPADASTQAAKAVPQAMPASGKVNGLAALPYGNPTLWWLTALCTVLAFVPLALVEFRRRSELVWSQQLYVAIALAEHSGFIEGVYPSPETPHAPMQHPHKHIYAKHILKKEIEQREAVDAALQREWKRWKQHAESSRNQC